MKTTFFLRIFKPTSTTVRSFCWQKSSCIYSSTTSGKSTLSSISKSRSFAVVMFGTAAAGTAGTLTLASCDEVDHRNNDPEVIQPGDEFYSVPDDYVPKTFSTNQTKMHRILGPCDICWKRFDMCIQRYVDGPVPDPQLAEQRCMKYGLPLVDCFKKNERNIMKRYAEE